VRNASALEVIQRQRWVILATFLTFVIVTAAVSKSLTKIYQTEASLLIAVDAEAQSFDTVQASQSFARSYSEIISSRNIAERVADDLADGTTADDLLEVVSFEPLSETQLLQISAEDPDPERAQSIANAYATVFDQYAQFELEPTTQAEVTVADSAPLPGSPARPKPTVYTLLAAFLGLAAGLGLAFLREQLDRRIRSAEELEEHFELPIVGRIPSRGRGGAGAQAFSEAFRMLRTNLQFVRADARLRSVAITSGRAGEGKTTTVASLALAAAEVGVRVIVVEGDMRLPKLQASFFPNRAEPLWPGLSNYLVEAADLDAIIHPTGKPSLSIVPAGPAPPSPSNLLEVRRSSQLVAGLRERADLVIFDTPPVSAGADAAVIANWTDGVLIMVDLAKSSHHGVSDALKQLNAVNARTIGFVVNRDRTAAGGRYGYYHVDSPASGRQTETRRGDNAGEPLVGRGAEQTR
jgi:receptor protein-tyrosine kinase